MMTTCDKVLAHEIMSACVQASDILGVDKAFADSLRLALAKFLRSASIVSVVCANGMKTTKRLIPTTAIHHICCLSIHTPKSRKRKTGINRSGEDDDEHRLAAEGWEDVEWSRANMVCLCPSERCSESGRKPEHPHDGFCARELADHIAQKALPVRRSMCSSSTATRQVPPE